MSVFLYGPSSQSLCTNESTCPNLYLTRFPLDWAVTNCLGTAHVTGLLSVMAFIMGVSGFCRPFSLEPFTSSMVNCQTETSFYQALSMTNKPSFPPWTFLQPHGYFLISPSERPSFTLPKEKATHPMFESKTSNPSLSFSDSCRAPIFLS